MHNPGYEHSGYTKQVAWIDQQDFQVRRVEFYDRRGDLLKTLTLRDYRRYHEKYWRAQELLMVNHKTAKETDFLFSEFEFGAGLKDGNFDRSGLTRLR